MLHQNLRRPKIFEGHLITFLVALFGLIAVALSLVAKLVQCVIHPKKETGSNIESKRLK